MARKNRNAKRVGRKQMQKPATRSSLPRYRDASRAEGTRSGYGRPVGYGEHASADRKEQGCVG